MDDCFVRCIKMPQQVKGFTMPGADGYNIYINERLDRAERIRAYRHELEHINNQDYEKSDVQMIERDVHLTINKEGQRK